MRPTKLLSVYFRCCFPVNWNSSLARSGLHFAPRPVLIKKQSGTVIGFRDVLVMNGMFLSWTKGAAVSTTVVSAFDSRRRADCRRASPSAKLVACCMPPLLLTGPLAMHRACSLSRSCAHDDRFKLGSHSSGGLARACPATLFQTSTKYSQRVTGALFSRAVCRRARS